MIRRLGTIVTLILVCSLLCLGQDDEFKTSPDAKKAKEPSKKSSGFDWDKVYLGGGLGLQFGSTTIIDVSPMMGYRFSEDLSAGVSISYLYWAVRNPSLSSSTYGGGPFVRYVLYENVFVHGEYQLLNSKYFILDQYNRLLDEFREDVHYLWIGGGFRQHLGGNSYLLLMALYNLNDSELSIYPINPIIRAGINIGL